MNTTNYGLAISRSSPPQMVKSMLSSTERGTKTRTGETEKSTNADTRVFKPNIWATPDMPSRCPVRLYRAFIQSRPPEACTPDWPFYIAVNHYHTSTSHWYKKQALGVSLLSRIMKELADRSRIQGRKTNHSAQKTMIQTLCTANVPDSTIMQLSGHKSVSSLNHYKKPSLDQQRSMSTLLSHCQPSCSGVTISATNQEVHDKNQLCTTQGLLTNATFNNCTLDITINTPGPTSQQVITPRTSHPAPKRPRVMYDSD